MNPKAQDPSPASTHSVSSFSKRKSFRGHQSLVEDIPQNDDEAEKERSKRSSGKFGQLAKQRVSLGLGSIAELSASELLAQCSNCMRLSAENKINHKNAFSLPLIDCMKLLLKKKDEQMENFQIVGVTLDASAKIYASRVDRVYMDGMSFAKGLGSRARDLPGPRDDGSGEDEPMEDNAGNVKKKKYKKVRKLCKDTTKINISLDAAEPDMTYIILSKKFSNCQPSFICFIPQLDVIGDSSKICMDMNRQFLSKEGEMDIDKETCVDFDCEMVENKQITGPPFREILARDIGDIDYDSILNVSALDDTLLEVDNEMDNDVNDPFCEPFGEATVNDEGFSERDRNTSTWNGFSGMETEATRAGCMAKNGPQERVVDLQEAILKQVKEGSNLDYTYMRLDRILFAGPSHWKRLPLSRVSDKEKNAEGSKRRERKVNKMDYKDLQEVKKPISRSCTFTNSYTESTWLSDKVTNPIDLHLDPKRLLRFSYREKICVNMNSSHNNENIPPQEDDDDVNDYDYNNLNDSQQFCPAALVDTQGEGDMTNSIPSNPEGGEPAADVHSFDAPESSDGWSMVDPPNKVARIAVPFAQHAKKIDMKVLKTVIWRVLCGDKQNEVADSGLTPKGKKKINNNIRTKRSPQSGLMMGNMEFSEMERNVMKIVPTDMAQELSMPLIFTALLHLANEKVLSLGNLEDHSDIIITQDKGAESFIQRLAQRVFV